ncbi:MAG: hypothetical protein HN368_12100, partial [Spirochaetales bacterium]|nr:hypothetical protein [Spirochaetales bacterium]
MRSEITERLYKFYTNQSVDRVPDIEFGYWPQTVRRWAEEGLPIVLSEDEQNEMFPKRLDDFFRFDTYGHSLPRFLHINPAFKKDILGRRGEVTIMRGLDGIVAERYLSDVERSSIPHFVDFPIKTADDWPDMKRRFRHDDSTRMYTDCEIDEARTAVTDGKMIQIGFTGFYGQLRNWMGMESLSYAFYDMPELILEMVEHWAELCAQCIERLPEDIPIDYVTWWEDMAGKNGPLVSPTVFREFLQPGYRRVMDA